MNTFETFEAIADALVAFEDDRPKTKRAVLAAWMDHEGVPMMPDVQELDRKYAEAICAASEAVL